MNFLTNLKKISFVFFLATSVFFLSGCLDAGLNLMAKRSQSLAEKNNAGEAVKVEEEGEKLPENEAKENEAKENEAKENETAEPLEVQDVGKLIDDFFKELEELIKKLDLPEESEEENNQEEATGDESEKPVEEAMDTNASLDREQEREDNEPSEEGLILCNQLNLENCGSDSPAAIVCAKVIFKKGDEVETSWLEFENSCQACQNSFQETEIGSLEVIGFKEGKCPLP